MKGTRVSSILLWALLLLFHAGAGAAEQSEAGPLSLAQAVMIVLEKSPLREAAVQGISAARMEQKAVRGQFLPKLKTGFDFTVFDQVPTIEIPAMPPIPAQQFEAGSYRQLSATTSLEQPLFTGGALLSQYRLAGLGLNESETLREAVRQDLILKTHESYFGVLVSEKLLEVADQAVLQLESHEEVARRFYETGMIPKNDVLKVVVQLADTRRKRIQASHQLEMARSQFNMLLRRDMDDPVILSDSLDERPFERTLEDCLQTARERHPDLLLSDLQIRKADQSVRLARSGLLPHLALLGTLAHEQGGFAEADKVLSATLHAEWSVWEWGSTYYRMKSAQSLLAVARAQDAQLRDKILLEVRQAFLAVREWKEAIHVARASIEQAKENFRITEEQFKASVTTSTEVLDAQTLLAQAQVNYYSALSEYNVSIARLEKAMGVLETPRSPLEGTDETREKPLLP